MMVHTYKWITYGEEALSEPLSVLPIVLEGQLCPHCKLQEHSLQFLGDPDSASNASAATAQDSGVTLHQDA